MSKLMKSLMVGLLIITIGGCSQTGDRLVPLANEALPKTVMLEVSILVDGAEITFDGNTIVATPKKVLARFRGAGVYVSPAGHILTCAHMINEGEVQNVLVTQYDGTVMKADILYKDDNHDLALLQVNVHSPYARIADPRKLKVGQDVFAIGNPLGMDFSVSHGIISALNRDELGVYNMTQSDAFINPGNSGGPLFNLQGELVGINSRVMPPVPAPVFTGLGFSVSAGQLMEFLTRFKGLEKAIR